MKTKKLSRLNDLKDKTLVYAERFKDDSLLKDLEYFNKFLEKCNKSEEIILRSEHSDYYYFTDLSDAYLLRVINNGNLEKAKKVAFKMYKKMKKQQKQKRKCLKT